MDERDSNLLPESSRVPTIRHSGLPDSVPTLILAAGQSACFAYEEFFLGRLRNPHSRRAYRHAVHRFFGWCELRELEVSRIAPWHVGLYLDQLHTAPATKKLHLAALRHFFDELVVRHVIVLNPAASVRGERHQVIEGKTPEIGVEAARKVLASIDTSHVIGLRDRAVLAVLIYTAARVGAVAKLQRQDLYDAGGQHCLRVLDKGGKSREIPVRYDSQSILHAYLQAAALLNAEGSSPLFRSAIRRTKHLTARAMTAGDVRRMFKRRLREARLTARLSPHSFRVYVANRIMWCFGLLCRTDTRFRGVVRHITGGPNPLHGRGDQGAGAKSP